MTLAPGCRLSGQSTARVSLASVHTGVPPTAAVLLAMPCVHVLGGNRAQSIRGHKAALPGASPSGGQCLTQKCTGIWGLAAERGHPPLLELLWVVLWWVQARSPALLVPL